MFDTNGMYKERRKRKAKVEAETVFVRNYSLPMTKEDCVEFLNYMFPRIHLSGSTGATRAWRSKFFAILSKLEFENKGNQKIQELVASYREQVKISVFAQFIIWFKSLSSYAQMGIFVLLFYVVFWIVVGSLK